MKLYGNLNSGNCYKVRLLLSYLGVSYEYVDMDAPHGATQTDSFLALNPAGQIPLLQLSDGRRLGESNAILMFLAGDTPYVPITAFDQAKVLQWMFWEQYRHEPAIAVARFIRTYAPDRAAELPKLLERGNGVLALMNDHLETRAWFVGSGPTVADITLYAYTHVAEDGGFDLDDYPQVQAWCARMEEHPKHILMTDVPHSG